MTKYRIRIVKDEERVLYFPQKRFLFFFWRHLSYKEIGTPVGIDRLLIPVTYEEARSIIHKNSIQNETNVTYEYFNR